MLGSYTECCVFRPAFGREGYIVDLDISHTVASNGLVANPTKTTFLIINNKTKSMNTIRIGDNVINQEKSAKLLGMQMLSRAASRGDLLVKGKTELRQSTFINDASKIWNNAPLTIKQSKTISSAKIEIKKFV